MPFTKFVKETIRPFLSKKKIQKIKVFLSYLKLPYSLLSVTILKKPEGTTLLCIDSPAPIGGAETQVHLIAVELKKMGLTPLIVTTGRLPNKRKSLFFQRLKQSDIEHIHLGCTFLLTNYTEKLLKKTQATHCHCFNPSATFLIDAAKKAGLKIIYSELGLPSQHPWWDPLRLHIDQIESLIAISSRSLSALKNLGYKKPIQLLYSLIAPPPPLLRARSPVPGEFKIVYFGRLHSDKGVYLLLSAFKQLLTIYTDAHLTFLGEGEARKTLEKQLKGTKYPVSFFSLQNNLFEQISQFDLMCLPSFSEGTPCTILEAMSIGLAVLATSVGGIPELIESEVSGILVPPHNEKALLEGLIRLAQNPELRKQIANQGFERFKEFSPSNIAPLLAVIYADS